MANETQELWSEPGAHCRIIRTPDGFEVRVHTGDGMPFVRRVAPSQGDARNQAEYLRVMLDRSRTPCRRVAARPPMILVVEDDGDSLCAYEEILKLEGFRSAGASTIAGARQLVRDLRPAAVILDHLLPDGEGASMCRDFRQLHGDETLPIALVTGFDPRHIALGTRDCPDVVLTKPCRPETLTAVLKLLLQRPRQVVTGVRNPSRSAAVPHGPIMTVRCPLCSTPGALLGADGGFLCQECGKEGTLARDQFADVHN